MTTALRPCTELPSPRIVVALSDALLRSELVCLLRDDGAGVRVSAEHNALRSRKPVVEDLVRE